MRLLVLFASLLLAPLINAQAYTRDDILRAIRQAGGSEQFLVIIAQNGAKNSNRMIDSQTELLSVQSSGNIIAFFNRHTSLEKSGIADLNRLRRVVAQRNAPSVCTAPIASILIQEYGVQYKYMIYDSNREYLFEYSFDRRTCAPGFAW